MELDAKTKELISVIDEIIILLGIINEKIWHNWMQKVSKRLKNSDFSGVELLLEAYGGMGSFNDFEIDCGNISGDAIACEKKQKFDQLRDKAYELAEDIQRLYNNGK